MSSAGSRSKNRKKAHKTINVRLGPPRLTPSNQWLLILSFFLLVATVALYLPVHHHPFVNYDDDEYVTDNVHVKAGLTGETVTWAFTTYDAANWHPLTWLSHALDYQLFQLDPAAHHNTNLLLHAVNVGLLFWVLWQATGYPGRSLMVAALFALHPINVESVAWIAERKNLLSMLFFLLALGAYRWYARQPHLGRYAAVTLLYLLGLMSKPQVITLPFVLLLWDYWPLRRMAIRNEKSTAVGGFPAMLPQRRLGWLVREKLPLFALSVASAVVTMRAQLLGGGINPDIPLVTRLANAIISYARYLGQAFWPTRLAPIYPYPVGSFKAWEVIGGINSPYSHHCSGHGRPASSLSRGGMVLVRRDSGADDWRGASGPAGDGRSLRISAVRWLVHHDLLGRSRLGRAKAHSSRVAGMPPAWQFSCLWRCSHIARSASGATMWGCGPIRSQVTNGNYLAEDNLGRALQAQGKSQDAMPHFARAAQIEPSYVFAYIHMGIYQHQHGDLQGALRQYQRVLGLTGNDVTHYGEIRREILVNMASAYTALGDFVHARDCLESAVGLNPDNPEEWTNLGILAQKTGNVERAVQAYSQAVRLQPTQRGYRLLAQALQQAGRQQEAQVAVQQGMALAGETR